MQTKKTSEEKKIFTIGEISEMFNLPVSTIRYYDSEELFPNLKRESGIRKFTENEIRILKLIECLKKSGLEIKDIKKFMNMTKEGPKTYRQRKELFETRKKVLKKQMEDLQKNMAMIEFKCWYYEKAIADGNEDQIQKMYPDKFPKEIQKLYNQGFSD